MRAKEKARLGTIRLVLSEIKRIEVDERLSIDDARALLVLDKMTKQRKDASMQFRAAGRDDLAQVEEEEIAVIATFLPAALSAAEVSALIAEAITATDASSMADMKKVIGYIKPKAQGRADLADISKQIKAKLS